MATALSEAAQEQTFKYRAFISYSHRDKKWGDWLHRSLETYRVPKRIIGQPTRDGLRPRRLFPIFRDREELPVSADLGTQINEALTQSRYLIVVCSPHSEKSIWVNEEIKFFKRLGREDRVLALIVAGEPNASEGKPGFSVEDECFPQGLRYRVGPDNEWSSLRTETVAGDARVGKDGKTNAKLKLLAGLLDVSFDTLKQREQDRRRRVLLQLTGLALLIALVMLLVALYAVDQERRAVAARNDAEDILNYLLYQLSEKLQPIGHLDIIEDVQKRVETYYKSLGFSQQDPNAINSWAALIAREGDRLLLQGDVNAAKKKFNESLDIEKRLITQNPADHFWRENVAKTEERLGDVLQNQGDLSAAKVQYSDELDLIQNLATKDPENNRWQNDLSVVYERLGWVLQVQGDLNSAKDQYIKAVEIGQRLTKQDLGNTQWHHDLAVGYDRLGDILRTQGELNDAKVQYTRVFEIGQKLAGQDPGNSQWQRDLSVEYEKLGDVLVAQGDRDGANAQYASAVKNAQKLAKQDLGNSQWQRDLSISYEKLGVALTGKGDLQGAKTACTGALAVRQQLTKLDPGNSQWQRDLSLGYFNLGIVLKGQGDLAGAGANFRESLQVLTSLIQAHGENAAWKADLDRVKKQLGE
jgi:tetratricopeptide (TPR) repeat protein